MCLWGFCLGNWVSSGALDEGLGEFFNWCKLRLDLLSRASTPFLLLWISQNLNFDVSKEPNPSPFGLSLSKRNLTLIPALISLI